MNLMRAFGVLAKRIRPVTGDRDQGKSDPHLSSYGHVFVSADGSWRGGGLLARVCSWVRVIVGHVIQESNSESTAEVLNYL
jgi:hypothetical protein